MRKRSFWTALFLSLLLTLTSGWVPASTIQRTLAQDPPPPTAESTSGTVTVPPGAPPISGSGEVGEADFEETLAPLEPIEGLMTLYRDQKKAKLLAEIRPDHFNRYYLMATTLSQGIGEFGFYRGMDLHDFPFTLRRANNKIQVVVPNLSFRTTRRDGRPEVLRESFSDSILYSLPIIATQAETDHVLVDLSPLFIQDPIGFTGLTETLQLLGYAPEVDQSYLQQIKNFEQNIELNAIYNFQGGSGEGGFFRLRSVPGNALRLGIHYSISELPRDNGYRPRVADERVGYFVSEFRSIAAREQRDPNVRYIRRWWLEKQDPAVELSPPKQPIVLWIENSVPPEYREAFREGALMWNPAFEKIGIKDAIEVRQMPDDADWDPADIRYNTIRWFEGLGSGFARGPSRYNPFTGEILDADILVGSDVVRFNVEQFETLVNGQSSWNPSRSESDLRANLASHLGGGDLDDCWIPNASELQTLLKQQGFRQREAWSPAQIAANARLQPHREHGAHEDHHHQCFASHFSSQVAYGSLALSSLKQVLPSSDEAQDFLHQSLSHLIAHEVGHILGLRHNFQGSDWLMPEELNDTAITQEKGLVSSVMDYVPVNLAPPGVEQGDYFPRRIGPYDEWAIEYGYRPLTPEKGSLVNERRELEAIAGRAAEPGLAYGTDEDALGLDPRIRPFDLSRDPLGYHPIQLEQTRVLWDKLNRRGPGQGKSYSELRRDFNILFSHYLSNLFPLTDYIGGRQFNRYRAGDAPDQVPLSNVPLEQQRQALDLLAKNLFDAKAVMPPAELLNKLPASRWNFSRQLDYPLYEQISFYQTLILSDLLSDNRLARLRDAELRGEPSLSLAELFETLHDSIWQQATEAGKLSALQRGLQRQHVTILSNMLLRNLDAPREASSFAQLIAAVRTLNAPDDARALARFQLHEVREDIRQIGRRSRDRATQAHCQDIERRIDDVLTATRTTR